jgi:threonine/homoserine/homoserine lactone efflux protein
MPSTTHLLAFAAAAAVIVAIPGPSLLFTIGRALTVGRRDALLTVAGNAAGLLAQTALVAVGLGAILAASSTAYTVVKLAGAAYLVYLGVSAIRHRGQLATQFAAGAPARRTSTTRALRTGLVVGLTNPKTMVFLSSLLPQFVDRDANASTQMLALGALFATLALVGDSIWAIGAGRARDWFARSPVRLRRLGGAGGAMMLGLGVAVAITGRPE